MKTPEEKEAARKKKVQYILRWRKENPEKYKAIRTRYNEKHREEQNARRRERERQLKESGQWEEVNARRKEYRRKYYREHREKLLEQNKLCRIRSELRKAAEHGHR